MNRLEKQIADFIERSGGDHSNGHGTTVGGSKKDDDYFVNHPICDSPDGSMLICCSGLSIKALIKKFGFQRLGDMDSIDRRKMFGHYEEGNAYYWCMIRSEKCLTFTKCCGIFYVKDYNQPDAHLLSRQLDKIWDFFIYTENYFSNNAGNHTCA